MNKDYNLDKQTIVCVTIFCHWEFVIKTVCECDIKIFISESYYWSKLNQELINKEITIKTLNWIQYWIEKKDIIIIRKKYCESQSQELLRFKKIRSKVQGESIEIIECKAKKEATELKS